METLVLRALPAILLLAYMALLAVSRGRPLLRLYLLFPAVPYAAFQITGASWPLLFLQWWIAAAHVLVSLECCFLALGRGTERWWLLLLSIGVGTAAASAVAVGDHGHLVKWVTTYYILTSACMFCVGACWMTAVYCINYKSGSRWGAPMLCGAYFFIDAAVNSIYRWRQFDAPLHNLLSTVDHAGHLLVVLAAILYGSSRSQSLQPRSSGRNSATRVA